MRKLRRWLSEVIAFAIFSWKNHGLPNWDWEYAVLTFQWKLARLREAIKKNNLHEEAHRTVRDMYEVDSLIDAWLGNDGYEEEQYYFFTEKYGKAELDFSNPEDVGFIYGKCSTPEKKEEASKALSDLYMRGENRRRKMKRDTLRFIRRRIETWWD